MPLPNSLFAHAELRCLVDSLRMMELRANTTKGCDSYLATQWNLGALVLVVGSNKDAKAGNESVIEMFFLWIFCTNSVKLKHCLLVLKGFICNKNVFNFWQWSSVKIKTLFWYVSISSFAVHCVANRGRPGHGKWTVQSAGARATKREGGESLVDSSEWITGSLWWVVTSCFARN